MSSAPSLAQVRNVFEALGPPGTPFTTPEIATNFDCTNRTIYNRLETLVEDGVLETKKVGARGRVWWYPVEEHRVTGQGTDEKYRRVFESIEKGCCIIEVLFDDTNEPVDYVFLETNSAFEDLTGLQDAEGKRLRELVPDNQEYYFDQCGAVAQTGESVRFTEYAENLGDRWYEIDAFRIGDPADHTVAVLIDDISGRKRAEHTVHESDQRLNALVEATTEGVYRISPDWSEIYQLPGEGFVAEDPPNAWQEYIPNDEQERVGEAIDEAITTQSPFELEHQIKRADGTVGWAHSKAVPILEDGEIVEWFGTATDITEPKEQQREKDLLWWALEKTDSPLLMAEPGEDDNPIVYVNEAFEQLTGYSESEMIGQDCRLLQGEKTREEPVRKLREAIENQEQTTAELRNYQKDGTEFWNRVTIVPVYDDRGELVRFVGTQEDITERKEQEQKRKQVIDRVTDGIFEVDADDTFTLVSDQAKVLLDASDSDLIGRHIWEIFEDARGTAFEKQYREVMETREPTSFLEYYSRVNKWFDVQAYPNDDGGISVYFRDITEQKEREQARKRAEQRYQKLLELAPVPIFAVDPTTEEILEANEAAGALIGCPADELVGRKRASVHPAESNDGYETMFRNAMERGGTWRHLPDGSPTYIVTERDEKIPVEITSKKVELEGEDVIYGVLKDITDQLEYQHRLDMLNEITHELFNAETEREVTQTAVETLADILEISTVAFYVFDEGELELKPVVHATASEEAEAISEPPVFEPGVGIEWRAFTDGRTAIVDDFQTREAEYEFERTVRSEMIVPISDWGVLIAGDTRPNLFDDWTSSLVETLAAAVEAALDYTEWEQERREQRQELREAESLNQQLRDITHTIVQADTRAEFEQSICERLIESDTIEFAWIGTVDFEDKAVIPKAQAGAGSDYLDSVSLTLDRSKDPEPSVEALQSRDACGSSNIATNIQHGDWRSTAIEREFRSVLSVPLIYNGALYGALTVYSRAESGFTSTLESVLQEFCDLIAHGSAAIEQSEALHTMQTTELEFEVQDEAALFCRLAVVLDCEIELERAVSQKGGSTLVFFSVTNGTPEELLKEAERLDEIEEGRLIERSNSTFVQLRITEPCIGSVLSNKSIILQQLFADSTCCRLTVEVPEASSTRQAVNIVASHYENAQLLAKRQSDTADSKDKSAKTALEELTPRQREVVETAYRSGYFDSPRRASGKELAEIFDFSNSTFHEHIRKAEQTLFENLIDDTNSSLVTQT